MIKFGLIGKGMALSECAAEICMAGAAVHAICDTESGRAAALADQYNIGSVYLDYRELFNSAELDALCVCGCEISAAAEAIVSGKHVLLYIPAVLSGEDTRKLQLLADGHRTMLQICVAQSGTEIMVEGIKHFLQKLP